MPSVRYEKSGTVGHIILCNPPHNYLNVEFYEELGEAVCGATSDDLRAVLVRAEGPNFCGGGEPGVLGSLSPEAFQLLMSEFNRSYRAIEALRVPTVAAIRGSVSGGGIELALSCDLIVAARDAVFRQMEVSLGNMPMAGGVQRDGGATGPCSRGALRDAVGPDDRRNGGRARTGQLRLARGRG